MIEIRPVDDAEGLDAARRLFREYQADLGDDLCFQGFEAELTSLPGVYASPSGRILLAYEDGEPSGCVALRSLAPGACEMKRLYVRPSSRQAGLGRKLVEQVSAEARTIGYQRMYLDTLPVMERAQRLYESLGFRDTPPYRKNPVQGARFLVLEL